MIQDSGISFIDVTTLRNVDAFLGPTEHQQLETLPTLDASDDATVGSGRYGEYWRLPLSHEARASVGERLALLGDLRKGVGLREDGLPDIDWVPIAAGKVNLLLRSDPHDPNSEVIETITRNVEKNFCMARYPITIAQFQSFLRICCRSDGLSGISTCHLNIPSDYELPVHGGRYENQVADSVNWFDAKLFCDWLSARFGFEVRLPTEVEWQLAATGGDIQKGYPWGRDWTPSLEPWRANTSESALGSATAVGMYPYGASPAGVMDMAGTTWEWCEGEFDDRNGTGLSSPTRVHVLRGGSWGNNWRAASCTSRNWISPFGRYIYIGFRVVCSSPS